VPSINNAFPMGIRHPPLENLSLMNNGYVTLESEKLFTSEA